MKNRLVFEGKWSYHQWALEKLKLRQWDYKHVKWKKPFPSITYIYGKNKLSLKK